MKDEALKRNSNCWTERDVRIAFLKYLFVQERLNVLTSISTQLKIRFRTHILVESKANLKYLGSFALKRVNMLFLSHLNKKKSKNIRHFLVEI